MICQTTYNPIVICLQMTKVFKDIYTIKDMEILQQDMQELEKWSNNWLLKFHPDKCNVLSVGKRNIPQFKYTLSNTKLKYTDKEKDIGVMWITNSTLKNI